MLMILNATCLNFYQQMESYYARWPAGTKPPEYLRVFVAEQLALMKSEIGDEYDFDHMNVLVLEQGQGLEFSKWAKGARTLTDYMHVFFQVFYTLAVFNELGLQQNDLHTGNVWIDQLKQPQWITYTVGRNKHVRIFTRWFVKLYDFDRATKYPTRYNKVTIHNTLIRRRSGLCSQYGQCNAPPQQPKVDSGRFLTGAFFQVMEMYYGQRATQTSRDVLFQVQNLIRTWVHDPRILESDPWAWSTGGNMLCLKQSDSPYCKIFNPTDAQMASNKQIVAYLQSAFAATASEIQTAIKSGIPHYNYPSLGRKDVSPQSQMRAPGSRRSPTTWEKTATQRLRDWQRG